MALCGNGRGLRDDAAPPQMISILDLNGVGMGHAGSGFVRAAPIVGRLLFCDSRANHAQITRKSPFSTQLHWPCARVDGHRSMVSPHLRPLFRFSFSQVRAFVAQVLSRVDAQDVYCECAVGLQSHLGDGATVVAPDHAVQDSSASRERHRATRPPTTARQVCGSYYLDELAKDGITKEMLPDFLGYKANDGTCTGADLLADFEKNWTPGSAASAS